MLDVGCWSEDVEQPARTSAATGKNRHREYAIMAFHYSGMKITAIRTYVLDAPLSENFGFSQWEFTRRSTMLVEIATDAGIEGWGEAYGPAKPAARRRRRR